MNSHYTKEELKKKKYAEIPLQYTSDIWHVWECFMVAEKRWSDLIHHMAYVLTDSARDTKMTCTGTLENIRYDIQELKEILEIMEDFSWEAKKKVGVLIAEEREEAKEERAQMEKGIPLVPRSRSATKYPWYELEVGDSFFVEAGGISNASVACANKRYSPKKFAQRNVEGGIRVWRIE